MSSARKPIRLLLVDDHEVVRVASEPSYTTTRALPSSARQDPKPPRCEWSSDSNRTSF